MLIGPGAVQDGLGIVLVRFFFRLVISVRFFVPLGLLLGPFGALLVPFSAFLEPIFVSWEPLWCFLLFLSGRS